MNDVRALLTLEVRSLFGINRVLHEKGPKVKKRSLSMVFAWVVLLAMMAFYIGILVYGLCAAGLSEIVPAYLTVITSAMIVLFGIFTAGNKVFACKGYDILVSMPIRPSAIVLTRFIGIYLGDLMMAVSMIVPGVVVYGVTVQPGFAFYLLWLVGIFFIPIIPLAISVLLGTAVLALTSRMKKGSLMQSLLMVGVVLGIMFLSFSMETVLEDVTPEQFLNLAKLIGDALGKIYPPALWLNDAVIHTDLLSLALFVAVSLAAVAAMVFTVAKSFHFVLHRLMSVQAKHNYKITKMESRSLLKALYLREAKRYFSSSIYVTNTIIGPILGTVMSVAILVAGIEALGTILPIVAYIPSLIPVVFPAIFCMMTTSSVSVSMEGKCIWISQSLPIPMKTWLDSKIFFNLSLMLPCYLVSEAALVIATNPGFFDLLWLLFLPLSVNLFCVVAGITINLKMHSFDWEQEAAVVKQSAPAMLGGFLGPIVCLLLGFALYFTPSAFLPLLKIAAITLLLAATVVLYRLNNRQEMAKL